MTNLEKIVDFALNENSTTLRNLCDIYGHYFGSKLTDEVLNDKELLAEWLGSKYEEPFPEVDWSKVEQGTPIQVWEAHEWVNAFFVCTYKGYIMVEFPDDYYLYKNHNDVIEAYNYEHGRLVE